MSINVEDNWLLLCDLVHDVAAQTAANVNNNGQQIDYLLANGFTEEDIEDWLSECNAP